MHRQSPLRPAEQPCFAGPAPHPAGADGDRGLGGLRAPLNQKCLFLLAGQSPKYTVKCVSGITEKFCSVSRKVRDCQRQHGHQVKGVYPQHTSKRGSMFRKLTLKPPASGLGTLRQPLMKISVLSLTQEIRGPAGSFQKKMPTRHNSTKPSLLARGLLHPIHHKQF